jgi:hypothetical protein
VAPDNSNLERILAVGRAVAARGRDGARLRWRDFPPGGTFDHWDIEVRSGLLGRSQVVMAIEEHGAGRQLVRVRTWPVWSTGALAAILLLGLLATAAAHGGSAGSLAVAGVLSAAGVLLLLRAIWEYGAVDAATQRAIGALQDPRPEPWVQIATSRTSDVGPWSGQRNLLLELIPARRRGAGLGEDG